MRILDNISIVQDPIHPGVVILDKLITDLKAKLPMKKGKAGDDELEERDDEATDPSRDLDRTNLTSISDDEEESPKDNSLINKLKGKIKGLNKKAEAGDSEDDSEESSDADAAKKKKSKIIQIVIVTGLVLFLVSDYIIPTEEEPAAPVSSFKKPERKKPVKKDTAATETPSEGAEASATETATTESTAPTENPTETASTEVTTETTPDSPVTVTSETAPTENPEATESTTPTEEPTIAEPTPVPTPDTTTPTIDLGGVDTSTGSVDSIDGNTSVKEDENLTDQILQDLEKQAKKTQVVKEKKEYVAPPDYEYRGRGLVYNCKGKHWACIDAPSYKICEDNASSVKIANKKTECHPFNVYETPRGCESMQNRMVSSSAKTNFCND